MKGIGRHGQIVCGTISVSRLDEAVSLYAEVLQQQIVEIGQVSDELALAWGTPKVRGAPYAVMRADDQSPSALRLVQVPESKDHVPATSIGWTAFEFTVRDVFTLAERLKDSGFDVVGPPKLVDGFTSFIPMQVFGPDGEVLFLNQVNHSDADADLPKTGCTVGEIFIVVLASRERLASVTEYVNHLGLQKAATHSLRYSLMNRAFSLPQETQQVITMVQNGRTPFAQVDQYPSNAAKRAQHPGWLPAGNSMVSMLVDDLDALALDQMAVGPQIKPRETLYGQRKTQVIRGAASELIELIENR